MNIIIQHFPLRKYRRTFDTSPEYLGADTFFPLSFSILSSFYLLFLLFRFSFLLLLSFFPLSFIFLYFFVVIFSIFSPFLLLFPFFPFSFLFLPSFVIFSVKKMFLVSFIFGGYVFSSYISRVIFSPHIG